MRALNGNMDLGFETLKIQGFDASRELARIGGFLKSNDAGKGFTDVLKLTGHIAVKNGVAETSDLQAQLDEGTLAVVGKSDLAEESLNLKATAVLSKAFSDKVGGTGVGGYLSTALSNDQGELVIPVLISGTFMEPKFAPDAQAFLQMQRNRLLPGLSNPGSALGNVLNSLTGGQKKTEEGQQPEAEPKPSGGLKGVLDGILGGKK